MQRPGSDPGSGHDLYDRAAPPGVCRTVAYERLGLLAASAVRAYPNFTIFDDVTIDVNQGTVTLQGRVTSPGKKDEIGQRMSKIDGVRAVINDIGILPASPVDADLRSVSRAPSTSIRPSGTTPR